MTDEELEQVARVMGWQTRYTWPETVRRPDGMIVWVRGELECIPNHIVACTFEGSKVTGRWKELSYQMPRYNLEKGSFLMELLAHLKGLCVRAVDSFSIKFLPHRELWRAELAVDGTKFKEYRKVLNDALCGLVLVHSKREHPKVENVPVCRECYGRVFIYDAAEDKPWWCDRCAIAYSWPELVFRSKDHE